MNISTIFESPQPNIIAQWDGVMRSSWHPILTIKIWGLVISLLTLLFQAAAIGLFKIWRLGLFSVLPEDLTGWMTDQLRVALVNIGTPFNVLWSTPARRTAFGGIVGHSATKRPRERGVTLFWLLGALIFTVLPLGTSSLISFAVPFVSGTPGSTSYCAAGIAFLQIADQNQTSYGLYHTLLALDMLRAVDSFGFNYSGTSAQSVGLPRPNDMVSVSAVCPDWAPVCDRNNSLRVDVGYSLRPSDLWVGGDNSSNAAEFSVMHTCYKVESHTKFLRKDEQGLNLYGLMYGDSGLPDLSNVTTTFRREEIFGDGYSVDSRFNARSPVDIGGWTPNDTLSHDGDLSLLIYHLGAISSMTPSRDPLFMTNSTRNDGNSYSPIKITVPIMCNTSFSACQAGKCTPINGTFALMDYAANLQGDLISKGFFNLMSLETDIPLLTDASGTSDSVLASRTLSLNSIQYAAAEISGHAEIVRLALTGRTRLITAARRAASTWRQYLPSTMAAKSLIIVQDESLKALCGATLIESNTNVTVAGLPLVALLASGFAIVALSYSGPIWRWLCWPRVGSLAVRWRSRGVGQLHRMVHEKGDPMRFWEDGDKEWPKGNRDVERFGFVDREGNSGGCHPVYGDDVVLLKEASSVRRIRGELS